MQTLKKHGLERFDPSEAGEKFDPNLHEATFMTKMEDKEDGSVFMTQQKGFLLNGRVIRVSLCLPSLSGTGLTMTITGCKSWCCEELMAHRVEVQDARKFIGAGAFCTLKMALGTVNVGKSSFCTKYLLSRSNVIRFYIEYLGALPAVRLASCG